MVHFFPCLVFEIWSSPAASKENYKMRHTSHLPWCVEEKLQTFYLFRGKERGKETGKEIKGEREKKGRSKENPWAVVLFTSYCLFFYQHRGFLTQFSEQFLEQIFRNYVNISTKWFPHAYILPIFMQDYYCILAKERLWFSLSFKSLQV